jgi:hypothetical protein
MPKHAPPNGGAALKLSGTGSFQRVSEMQTKLHCWAAADPGRRFDDLFNLVYDPATLLMAFVRVAGNRGAMTAGVDGWTVATVEDHLGVRGFLDDLRTQLRRGRSGRCRCVRLLRWAGQFGLERRWAVEDCRHLSRRLERDLLAAGERIVRVRSSQASGGRWSSE